MGNQCRMAALRRLRFIFFPRSPGLTMLLVTGFIILGVMMISQTHQNIIINTEIKDDNLAKESVLEVPERKDADKNVNIEQLQKQLQQPKQVTQESLCKPRDSVVFIKTHKCASSTVQRIFLRYGNSHNLTFALPAVANYIGHPQTFTKSLIPKHLRTPDEIYNMIVVHTRFQYENMAKVVNKDARWVTILREPMDQMESQWAYYDLQEFYKMNISEWSKLPYNKISNWRLGKSHGIHQMMFDLGHGAIGNLSDDDLSKEFKRLEEIFDLVMIAEQMDESLVFLKHLMCWTTEDIAYLKINFREEKNKKTFAKETRNRLIKLDKPDVLLYDFFKNIFQKKVEAFGTEKMRLEVEKLRLENERIAERCLDKPVNQNEVSGLLKPKNDKVQAWMIKTNSTECLDMVMNEIDFIDKMRQRQFGWNNKLLNPYKGNVKRTEHTADKFFQSLFAKFS